MTTISSSGSISDAALTLAQLDWKLFPVHGVQDGGTCTCGSKHDKNDDDRKKIGKHPVIEKWQEVATSDPAQIADWWNENPRYNIAVVCNRSGLVVIDVDPRSGGLESLETIEVKLDIQLPQTVQSFTGAYDVGGTEQRGIHFFFKAPEGITFKGNLSSSKKGTSLPGIDIKHNGYVVLAPSAHMSGVNYEWREGHEPSEREVSELSEEVQELISKSHSHDSFGGALISDEQVEALRRAATTTSLYGAKALAGEVAQVSSLEQGARNSGLFSSTARIGSLIAGGQISWDEGISSLLDAAALCGLEEAEAKHVILREDGALVRGLSTPRGPAPISDALVKWAQRMSSQQLLPEDEPEVTILQRANILDWKKQFAGVQEQEEWLVPGLFCAERGHSLYSDAGLGKSLMMREVAACLASGRSVLGHPAKQPMRVLYFDYENNPDGDVTASLRDMGFEAEDLENLFVSSFPEFDSFDTPRGGLQVMELVDELKPRLVIIDTVSRVVDGDENSNDTWIRFYKNVGLKLKQRQIAYVRLDHEGKNTSGGARGGSAKRGDVDFVWHYTGVKPNTHFKMKSEKSRVLLDSETVTITRHREPVLHHLASDAEAGKHTWAALYKMVQENEKALELLRENFDLDVHIPGQKAAWEKLQTACEANGITKTRLNKAIAELKEPTFFEEDMEEFFENA